MRCTMMCIALDFVPCFSSLLHWLGYGCVAATERRLLGSAASESEISAQTDGRFVGALSFGSGYCYFGGFGLDAIKSLPGGVTVTISHDVVPVNC